MSPSIMIPVLAVFILASLLLSLCEPPTGFLQAPDFLCCISHSHSSAVHQMSSHFHCHLPDPQHTWSQLPIIRSAPPTQLTWHDMLIVLIVVKRNTLLYFRDAFIQSIYYKEDYKHSYHSGSVNSEEFSLLIACIFKRVHCMQASRI